MQITEAKTVKPPKKLFECKICSQIFIRPITLPCGHTFCRQCLKQPKQNPDNNLMLTEGADKQQECSQKKQDKITDNKNAFLESNKSRRERKSKIPTCIQCSHIIWKPIDLMCENKTLQNLSENYYGQEIKERLKKNSRMSSQNTRARKSDFKESFSQNFKNKILLRINDPDQAIPMPSCFSTIKFSTHFFQQIIQQNQLVITWKQLYQMGLGLVGSIKNIKTLYAVSYIIPHEYENDGIINIPEQKYSALFLGKAFVKIIEVGAVPINMMNRFVVIQNHQKKLLVDLQICDCELYHAQSYDRFTHEDYKNFFQKYDQLNNPYFMRKLGKLISQAPFHSRSNSEEMIYCAMKVMKFSNKKRKELVMSFNDEERIAEINKFIDENTGKQAYQIFNLNVPGQSSTTFVLVTIFILVMINYLQNS